MEIALQEFGFTFYCFHLCNQRVTSQMLVSSQFISLFPWISFSKTLLQRDNVFVSHHFAKYRLE